MKEVGKVTRKRPTLVIIDDVPDVVSARVMSFAHATRVVREIDIAVIAEM